MSKHRHNRPQFQPQDRRPVTVVTDGSVAEKPETVTAPVPKTVEETPEQTPEVAAVLEATTAVPAPVEKKTVIQEPEVPMSKPAVVVSAKPKENRVMAEQLYPSQSIAQKRAGIKPARTPQGARLARLYDEYKTMMGQKTNPNDRRAFMERAEKLHSLFQAACPSTKIDSTTAADLIRVSFDCVMDGWGTVYTDGTLFRMDYSLYKPGIEETKKNIDKVDMFFTSIVQLVEGIVDHRRVMFDRDRLSRVIGNQEIVSAIIKMKDGINNYNVQHKYI